MQVTLRSLLSKKRKNTLAGIRENDISSVANGENNNNNNKNNNNNNKTTTTVTKIQADTYFC